MKIISAFFLASLICIQLYACNKNNEIGQTNDSDNTSNTDTTKMKITVGSAVFTATLNNNATVTTFREMLPLTINMSELNGNEKFYYFPATLPTNASSEIIVWCFSTKASTLRIAIQDLVALIILRDLLLRWGQEV